MCEECFTREISRFASEKEYDAALFRIRSQPNLCFVCRKPDRWAQPRFYLFGVLGIGKNGEDVRGYDLVQCSACGQYWELNEPDYAWRGFLRAGSEASLEGCTSTVPVR